MCVSRLFGEFKRKNRRLWTYTIERPISNVCIESSIDLGKKQNKNRLTVKKIENMPCIIVKWKFKIQTIVILVSCVPIINMKRNIIKIDCGRLNEKKK